MRAGRTLIGLVATLLVFADVSAACGQAPEVAEADSPKQGAPEELLPAQLVADQIRAALANPGNTEHLDEAERLLASAALDQPGNTITLEPEPSLEAITPLAARLGESRDRISELASQARAALPSGTKLTALEAPWMPWVAIGLLLVLFFLSRSLSKPTEHRSVRTARKLARQGIVAGEVARRTGLSQDVIHLIKQRSKRREPREVA